MIEALALVLKASTVVATREPVCMVCGDKVENLTDPTWAYELPVTACVRCGAHHDAQMWWKRRNVKKQSYFIGDLSALTQAERSAYLTAFASEVNKLESRQQLEPVQAKPAFVKPRARKSTQERFSYE